MLASRLLSSQAACGSSNSSCGGGGGGGSLRDRRRAAVICEASKPSTRGKKIDPNVKRPGFRYDPANSRWIRDDRVAEDAWKVDTTVQPLSGPAYTVWPVMHTLLVEKKLQSIPAEEVQRQVAKGAVLVDVRTSLEYEKQHCSGAVSVPLYTDVKGSSWQDTLKKVAMGALAMRATERNINFAQDVERAVGGKGKRVIVCCAAGGSLKTVVRRDNGIRVKQYNDPERSFGWESRSLKAAYELFEAGFTNIQHLEGGLSRWRYDGFPIEP